MYIALGLASLPALLVVTLVLIQGIEAMLLRQSRQGWALSFPKELGLVLRHRGHLAMSSDSTSQAITPVESAGPPEEGDSILVPPLAGHVAHMGTFDTVLP
jgi:hypothetical protein